MLRRSFSSSSSLKIIIASSSSTFIVQKRFIFSGMDSTSSSFLAFSKMTEKNSEPEAKKEPEFFPYHKNHLSTKRFHWKEPAKRMLKELKENNMEPTHRTSNWWSFHDPVEPLQKQHAIEFRFCREIMHDPANHSFQKDAYEATEKFLSTSQCEPTKEAECKTFADVIKFRIKHGVALPTEIALGIAAGLISTHDVEDKEALALAQELSPDVHCPKYFSTGGDFAKVSSAITHASGVGWNYGRINEEWTEITDHFPLGIDPIFDRSKEKSLVKPQEAAKPSSSPSSPAYYYPKRLAKIQDWSKAHIVFIDTHALNRGVDYRYGSGANDSSTWFASWAYSDGELSLSPPALFGPPGFTKRPEGAPSSTIADSNALNRWHHMLCVPKISSFTLAVSTNHSELALEALFNKMAEDPNLIVVFQHSNASAVEAGYYSGQNGGVGALIGSTGMGGFPDMNVVEQVFLRSLPIHGYTTTTGWQSAFTWIEDVLKNDLGFPLDTIPVSCVTTGMTKDRWLIEPGSNRLSQMDDGGFKLDEQLLPKCCFDAWYPVFGTADLEFFVVEQMALKLVGYGRNFFESDNCALMDILKARQAQENFWSGIPMPTSLSRLRDDVDDTVPSPAGQKSKNLKWWAKESSAYPYYAKLQ